MANENTVIDGGNGVTADQLSELFNQIKSGQINGYKMQALIEGRNPYAFTGLPAWKIINHKKWQSVEELISKAMEKGVRVDVNVWTTLQKAIPVPEPIDEANARPARLIVLSVKDLGFKKKAFYQDICNRAQRFELKMCDPRMILQLVLQCEDLTSSDTVLYLAMKAITDTGGLPVIYELNKETYQVICVGYTNGRGNRAFDPEDKFIFEL